MKYFIGDLHLGHENIIATRPCFPNIDVMDESLIRNWNKKVKAKDEVYILGDFSFRAKKSVHSYLLRLKGRKHLIVGNHDARWMKEIGDLSAYFESVSEIKIIHYENQDIVLCHYPMLEWPGKSYMIHGHIHGNKDSMVYRCIKEYLPMVLNASADINYFEPVSIPELIRNNEVWYER